MKITNEAKATIWYGLHCYPGAAEYKEPGKDMFRVFLNEDTLRSMDPTFAGKPVFVLHVDEIEESLGKLREKADGWVVESFFNAADGKHWVKFITVSDEAARAIANGMKLSNAYIILDTGAGGEWNGIAFQKQITRGEYEHLALVPNPRYDESVIMTAEDFKAYNEAKTLEIKRLANDKESPVLNLFKRAKVENADAKGLEGLCVVLPKSKREVELTVLVNEMDDAEEKKAKESKEPPMCNGDHHVMVGDEKMTVNELLVKHKAMCDEMNAMKNDEEGDEMEGEEHEGRTEKEEKTMNAADEAAAAVAAKKVADKAKADALRNAKAPAVSDDDLFATDNIDTPYQQLARGAARYG